MARLLIIEDNVKLNKLLLQGLAEAGYEVLSARTVEQGVSLWRSFKPLLVVLDRGLPDGDGLAVLETMREEDAQTRVILLTARDMELDRLQGFEGGADDYVVKPFSFPELLARIARHLERAGEEVTHSHCAWMLNSLKQQLLYDGAAIELTPLEMRIMALLLVEPGALVSRAQIYEEVWPDSAQNVSLQNTLEVHLSHLRDKLKTLCDYNAVETVRGQGYRLREKT